MVLKDISNTQLTEEHNTQCDQLISSVDKHVGARMKIRRSLLGLTQEYVADFLNVSFQQVQKYEKGVNRIGAGRLWRIATLLGVPVSYFYEELETPLNNTENCPCFCDNEEEPVEFEAFPRMNKSSMELLRAFSKIKDPAMSKNILELVKSCAAQYEMTAGKTEEID